METKINNIHAQSIPRKKFEWNKCKNQGHQPVSVEEIEADIEEYIIQIISLRTFFDVENKDKYISPNTINNKADNKTWSPYTILLLDKHQKMMDIEKNLRNLLQRTVTSRANKIPLLPIPTEVEAKVNSSYSETNTACSSDKESDDLESRIERLREILQLRNAEIKARKMQIEADRKHQRIVKKLFDIAKIRTKNF